MQPRTHCTSEPPRELKNQSCPGLWWEARVRLRAMGWKVRGAGVGVQQELGAGAVQEAGLRLSQRGEQHPQADQRAGKAIE